MFDLDASLLTQDSTLRKTYTVPFLEKGDRFSTFNLVVVTDSLDNLLDQYVLKYEFDSIQYQSFLDHKDFLQSGAIIKRFSFSNFFNDSNPNFLERCQGVFDGNRDPVVCDQVTIDSGSGSGGSTGGGGDAWITPGGGGTPGSGSGSISCSWTISYTPCGCDGASHTHLCNCGNQSQVITIRCDEANRRKLAIKNSELMTCMDCEVSDFGSPAFTLTRTATAIDRELGGILSDFELAYLSQSQNQSFSDELLQVFQSEINVDVDAALFTVTAGMNGAFSGRFNSTFGLAIDGLMVESEANFSNDIVIRLLQAYFEVKYAILKQANPNWSSEKLFYETAKEAIHLALDGIGLIEGLGTPADLLNAGLYYLEGDRVNGNLSLVAATPVIGLFSTTVKGALRLKGIIPGTSRKISQIWVKDGGLIKFGGTRLRTAMGITDPSKHAHHILPLEHVNHPVIQKAAKAKNNPFHINEIDNGIAVDMWQNTSHPSYNSRIEVILDLYNEDFPNATPDQAMIFLQNKMDQLSQLIQNNPNVKINDLNFK
ncbi:AHH domain-containing protein [Algoriphagus hitonicola]|uniref:AHH domain-containing protein n=1 Tax=Algoriphagus hitonicola TaxID=435880 RepID=UPI0011610B10|nr:AHH domain-containing protein [Algoriphagus hitonicola]